MFVHSAATVTSYNDGVDCVSQSSSILCCLGGFVKYDANEWFGLIHLASRTSLSWTFATDLPLHD